MAGLPETLDCRRIDDRAPQGKRPGAGFRYSSDANPAWLSLEQMQEMAGD